MEAKATLMIKETSGMRTTREPQVYFTAEIMDLGVLTAAVAALNVSMTQILAIRFFRGMIRVLMIIQIPMNQGRGITFGTMYSLTYLMGAMNLQIGRPGISYAF
jgi:hypothetical protein